MHFESICSVPNFALKQHDILSDSITVLLKIVGLLDAGILLLDSEVLLEHWEGERSREVDRWTWSWTTNVFSVV